MKCMLLAAVVLALIITGCVNKGGTSISFVPDEKKADEVTTATPHVDTTLRDISGSKDIKTLLAQNWDNKDDAQEAALSGGGGAFEMPYRGFSFFADGSVVQNPRDDMRFGKWAVDDAGKLITITYNNGTKAEYTIIKIADKDLVLAAKGEKKNIEYGADGKVPKNIMDDPFFGPNNQWRIKPGKPETDEEIRQRTQQALAFYKKFLEYHIAKGAKAVSFVGIPSIFFWYKGGVAVTPKEKIEEDWIKCFYNEEQATKAQIMLENIIGKKYKWDKNEPDWLRQDADGVKQIADTLAVVPMAKLLAK